jgi:DNA-binding NtrC family response regulator
MGGQRQVLVLDDDQLFRELVADELLGIFGVLACGTVQEALAALERNPDVVAVVADLRLDNGPSGAQLLSYVRRLLPGCRRVLVSGSAGADEVEEAIRKDSCQVFLHKPWGPGELLKAIRRSAPPGL